MTYKEVNKLLKKIFEDDQNDRISKKFSKYSNKKKWQIISSRDKKRLQVVKNIFQENLQLKGIDYFRAGLIAQHSPILKGIKFAQLLAKKGIKKKHKKSKWLYAAATDRLLIMQKKPQKYGTQYAKINNKWCLLPVNPKTTDKERLKYNVVLLEEAFKKESQLNKNQYQFKRKSKLGITMK